MGGASTLMFLREAARFRFFTVQMKASGFAALLLYYYHATKRLLCPTAMLTRSCATLLVSWNAKLEKAISKKKKNSRLVTAAMLEILPVNGEDVREQDPTTVRHITSKFAKTSNSTLVIRGIQSLAKHEEHENSFIFAIALDSIYSDLSWMLVDMKSAHKRSLRFPPDTNTVASKIIANSISKVAGFSVGYVEPIDALENTHLPCLFVHCSEADIVRPECTIQMFEKYSSKHKLCLSFDGSHHQNRPQFVLDPVCSHFQTTFAKSVEEWNVPLLSAGNHLVWTHSIYQSTDFC